MIIHLKTSSEEKVTVNGHRTTRKITRALIARFFVCLVIAFLFWFFVMYTESPEYEQKFSNINVVIKGYSDEERYELKLEYPETITTTFRGTNQALAACEDDHIVAVLNVGNSLDVGEHNVTVEYEFSCGKKLTALDNLVIPVTVTMAEMSEKTFDNIPVTVKGYNSEKPDNQKLDLVSDRISITVRGRTEDLEAMKLEDIVAEVILSGAEVDAINDYFSDDTLTETSKTYSVALTLPKKGMVVLENPINVSVSIKRLPVQTNGAESPSTSEAPSSTTER